MNKKEVLELKRRFKKDAATFTQLVGCYVDCNHNKICKFGGKFLTLEEDEYYKYLEIANKVLSGTLGNNLLNLEVLFCMYVLLVGLLILLFKEGTC